MSDTTDTANKLIDVASQKMDAFGTKLDHLAHQYGPEIMNGALQVARIDALNAAVFETAYLIMCVIAIYFVVKLTSKWAFEHAEESDGWSLLAVGFFTFVPLGIFFYLLNVWPYVGIFEPKLWLAHKLLSL